jgi:hypothetical protein
MVVTAPIPRFGPVDIAILFIHGCIESSGIREGKLEDGSLAHYHESPRIVAARSALAFEKGTAAVPIHPEIHNGGWTITRSDYRREMRSKQYVERTSNPFSGGAKVFLPLSPQIACKLCSCKLHIHPPVGCQQSDI